MASAGDVWDKDPYGDPLPEHAVARIGTNRLKHEGAVVSVRFHSSGKTLLSASQDGTIRRWNLENGRETGRIELKEEKVQVVSMDLSPDGTRVVATGSTQMLYLYRWEGEEAEVLWKTEEEIPNAYIAVFLPGTDLLAAGDQFGKIHLLRRDTGETVRTLDGHANRVAALTPFPGGDRIASAGQDNTVRVWDVESGEELLHFHTKRAAYALAVSPDGSRIAAGCTAKIVTLWDADTGKEAWRTELEGGYPASLAFSPDGETVAAGFGRSQIQWWDAESGEMLPSLLSWEPSGSSGGYRSSSITFSPDGTRLAMGTPSHAIRIWNLETGEERFPDRHAAKWNVMEFGPSGEEILTAASNQHELQVWDARTGSHLRSEPFSVEEGELLRISSDGKRLYLKKGKELHVVDRRANETIGTFEPTHRIQQGAFSPDGRFFAAAGYDPNAHWRELGNPYPVMGRIEIWRREGETWDHVTLPSDSYYALAADFSPASDILLTTEYRYGQKADGSVGMTLLFRFRDPQTGAAWHSVSYPLPQRHSEIAMPEFSSDGRLLLLSGGDDLHVLETATGKTWQTVGDKERPVSGFALSPDDRVAAAGRKDGSVTLLRIATGENVELQTGSELEVRQIDFSPDGSRLAALLSNHTILVWNLEKIRWESANSAEPESSVAFGVLWKRLGSDEPSTAIPAVIEMARHGMEAVRFLESELEKQWKTEGSFEQKVREALSRLNHESYEVRERASEDLKRFGRLAEEQLQDALKDAPSVEARNRIRRLLDPLETPMVRDPNLLRTVRGIWVLEEIGNAECIRLLRKIPRKTPRHPIRAAALQALSRLDPEKNDSPAGGTSETSE